MSTAIAIIPHSIPTKDISNENWRMLRRKGIGGSDVAAILGQSRYKTALQVYEEKLGIAEDQEDNERMMAGRRLEPVIAKWWSETTGRKIRVDYKIRIHPKYSPLIGNIDRLITSSPGHGPEVLECKNTNGYSFKIWQDDGLPPEYYYQGMHYLSITGYECVCFAILVDGYKLYTIEVMRDDELIETMNEQLLDFWYNNVLAKKAPDPQNSEDIARKFRKVDNEKTLDIAGNTTIINTCHELLGVKQQLKPLEEKKKRLEEEIKMVMQDSAILMSGDEKLVTWKQASESTRFDDKALLEDYPELYKKYLYTVLGTRRFILSLKGGE